MTKTDFIAKLQSLKQSKHLLVENEIRKLNSFNASYFRAKNYFDNDGTQNYLVFEPM